MKPNTPIWIRCDNIGRPADKLQGQFTTRDATMAIAKWLLGLYLCQKIRITIARSEEELLDNKRSTTVQDMMGDLESLIGEIPDSKEESAHG